MQLYGGADVMQVTDLFENRPEEGVFVLSQFSCEKSSPASVVLNAEHTLKLYRKNVLLHTFACSPADLGALCAGWLVTEGYGGDGVEIARDGRTAEVLGGAALPAEPERLCLPCVTHATTREMLALFGEASGKYARSHGVHECVIKGNGWHILRTDIGRHNAIDKAVGAAVLAGYDLRGAVMFTSGRINVQTVRKAVRCGIGCLMSKAVITAEALALAQTLGLKVLFSVKENSHICP